MKNKLCYPPTTSKDQKQVQTKTKQSRGKRKKNVCEAFGPLLHHTHMAPGVFTFEET